VLVTGMAIGTIFTLFFVPVIYMLIARDHRAEEAEGEPTPTPGGGRLSPAPAAEQP
jgi:multidrug efflux pump